MEDGWSWSKSGFLADAYNYNAPNGVFGDLGNGYFIERTEKDDGDDGYYYSYKLSKKPTNLAQGGLAQTNKYPRRELLVEGPGTERSDDIPAMLSDGEFVLNAKSVRGADPTGGGDRYKGAQHLYEMMRGFEMRG